MSQWIAAVPGDDAGVDEARDQPLPVGPRLEPRRRAVPRQQAEDLRARGQQAGALAPRTTASSPTARARRGSHGMTCSITRRHVSASGMPTCTCRPCTPWRRAVGPAYVDEPAVVRLVGDLLLARDVRRMRAGRGDRAADLAAAAAVARRSERRTSSASSGDAHTPLFNSTIDANSSCFTSPRSAAHARDHLARRRTLRERLRVDEHQLLLDAEREDACPSAASITPP